MNDKYGFVYIWRDRKHKRYYVGCHWGRENDGYICSSSWMNQAYKIRPQDFKRRILKSQLQRKEMYAEEQRFLNMISVSEIKPKNPKPRYYNLSLSSKDPWHQHPDKVKTIGQKISAAKKGKPQPFSAIRAENISKAKRGKPVPEKQKKRLQTMHIGRVLTEEHKAKIREGVHRAMKEGHINNNVSKETRKRISEAQKRRHALNRQKRLDRIEQ